MSNPAASRLRLQAQPSPHFYHLIPIRYDMAIDLSRAEFPDCSIQPGVTGMPGGNIEEQITPLQMTAITATRIGRQK